MRRLDDRQREVIAYLVFGVLTTLVNIVCYWALAHPLGMAAVPASVLAWVASVLFAYVTNRTWVFGSRASGMRDVMRECAAFFAARLATGALDWAVMGVCVDLLALPDLPVKVASNVVVVILNYVASKLVVFARGDQRP